MTNGQGMGEEDDAYRALGGVGNAPKSLHEQVKMWRERCVVLKTWMPNADWDALCRAHPPAAKWFDE